MPRKINNSSLSQSIEAGNGISDELYRNLISSVISTESVLATVAATICDVLNIPNLSRRAGLKSVLRDFDVIYAKLDDSYQRSSTAPLVRGAIACIYSKMAVDALLRDKLLQKDFLSRIYPLLDDEDYCTVALRCLKTVTHHGGLPARQAVALKFPLFVRLLDERGNDAEVLTNTIGVVSHALSGCVSLEARDMEARETGLVNSLRQHLPGLIRSCIASLRRPAAGSEAFHHVLNMLGIIAKDADPDCDTILKAIPSAVDFLIGCLRSPIVQTRIESLSTLVGMHVIRAEPEIYRMDFRKLIASIENRLPYHITDALMNYGLTKNDTYIMAQSALAYQKAMVQAAQDLDLVSLGKKLYFLIGQTEYAIGLGGFADEEGEIVQTMLPFKQWQDALPHCATALRQVNPPCTDMADTLELKYAMMQNRIAKVVSQALSAIQRNPNEAYFYYATMMGSSDPTAKIKFAKQGLRCKNLSQYVQFALMFHCIESLFQYGLHRLETALLGQNSWEEGYAYLQSGLEDCAEFISKAPPDNRNMKATVLMHILLTLCLRGDELSADLRELTEANKKLHIADECWKIHSDKIPQTAHRITQDVIIKKYAIAARDWDETVRRLDSSDSHDWNVDHQNDAKNRDVTEWLEQIVISDVRPEADPLAHCRDCVHGHHHTSKKTRLFYDGLTLYRCAWCQNPSASLKKCSGCDSARYCDLHCQKSHWTAGHKIKCRQVTTLKS